MADTEHPVLGQRQVLVGEVPPWLVLLTGLVVALAVPGPLDGPVVQGVVIAVQAVLVVVLLLRCAQVARQDPTRRRAMVAVAVFLVPWLIGSAILHSVDDLSDLHFPSVAEVFFVPAYLALVAFLVLDVGRTRRRASWTAWLDTVVLSGSAACLAGAVLLSPMAAGLDGEGPGLLLAVVYPLVDVSLAVLVVGQVVLGHRGVTVRTVALVGSLLGLAVCDTLFLGTLADGTYAFDAALTGAYAVCLTVLVLAATRRAARPGPVVTSRQSVVGLLAAAALVALGLLVVRPSGASAWYVVLPAVVTLAASVARLVAALRVAQRAADAFRASETDDLTDLPNRRALRRHLQERHDAGQPVALALLDLDGFKEINDSLGHGAGDQVLAELAERLRATSVPVQQVARLGGDEFALVLDDTDALTLLGAASQVRDELSAPLVVDGVGLSVRTSVGVARRVDGDGPGVPPSELLRRADVAMYRGKEHRNGVVLFEPHHDVFSRDRLRLGEQLRRGVTGGELVVEYQPQVRGDDGRPVAVEALVRWQHPEDGLLPPALFLPAARSCGLMGALTHVVVGQALRDLRQWLDAGLDLRVAVNCAPPELLEEHFVPRLLAALAAAEVAPDRLVLEITEDCFMQDPEASRQRLLQLRRAGVRLSVDDYGSGFSSLAYVRDLPVQQLKVDRAFVAAVAQGPTDHAIVAATADLAAALGLELVAEGVQDEACHEALHEMGVDVLQGYHVARPLPAAHVPGWVLERIPAGRTATGARSGGQAERRRRVPRHIDLVGDPGA